MHALPGPLPAQAHVPTNTPCTRLPPCTRVRCRARLQAKYPGVTVASFDTTEESLENLAAELGVKGLPQFRFYKVGAGCAACCICWVLAAELGVKGQPQFQFYKVGAGCTRCCCWVLTAELRVPGPAAVPLIGGRQNGGGAWGMQDADGRMCVLRCCWVHAACLPYALHVCKRGASAASMAAAQEWLHQPAARFGHPFPDCRATAAS